ncbi:hypothetical protein [Actinokineospora terrae]|uniref:Uncharacterized protein n=1 Tax=Actinokineospora terrae TaxID=155974 RepID=A0A1H9QRI5_9PSEU|nr:hypothetical protein [Actinokineospora terrae]SER62449.1 hypothetical protein SAMN04487818_104384 [Actinokineospora terrae]
MRLVRVGETTSEVGAHVRAALTSWGRGDAVAGGIALLGVRVPGFGSAVEAVVLLPRGVLVVLGVDLPDPALRLEAPLEDRWKVDGWPISRPDGPVNPAANALGATAAVAALVREKQPRPLPVCTVVAVGPYVSQVDQPAADKDRGVRILHPEPMTLLAVARELAVHTRPCPIDELRRVLAVLEPGSTLTDDDLAAEGFPDGLSAEAAAERTTILPLTALRRPAPPAKPKRVRWWPVVAAVVVALVLVVGIAVAVSADNSSTGPARGTGAPAPEAVEFAGVGTASATDCAAHTDGEVRTWLERNGCARLLRGRFEATTTGHRAAVLVGVLRFTGSTSAAELKAVLDRPGAGTVLDQAAEGVAWPGGAVPPFQTALRASGREGNSVKLVQVVWLDQPSTQDDPVLREIVGRAMRLTLSG